MKHCKAMGSTDIAEAANMHQVPVTPHDIVTARAEQCVRRIDADLIARALGPKVV